MRAVSLFSNCGAGDSGFAAAGFRFEVMAELIPSRLDVALLNHEGAHGIHGDLRQTWYPVVEAWRARHGPAQPDLLAACPPCQGMSTARPDRGMESDPDTGARDPRNLLVLPIARVAARLKPRLIVVENVPAFLRRRVRKMRGHAGVSAARLLVRLLSRWYTVYPLVTDLADYGVPQRRIRTFLTFVHRASGLSRFLDTYSVAPYPIPTHAVDHGGRPVTLAAALAAFGLPTLDAQSPAMCTDTDRPLHFVPAWPPRQYQMVSLIPAGTGASAWDTTQCVSCGEVSPSHDAATCPICLAPLPRPIVIEETGPRLVSGFRRGSYKRMDPQRPAATITTASGRIGGSHTIHPTENRVLSPLECALLQTIPEEFNWGNILEQRGVTELRAMIGEAVPPRFTELHGKVLTTLLRSATCNHPLPATDTRCVMACRALGVGPRKSSAQGVPTTHDAAGDGLDR